MRGRGEGEGRWGGATEGWGGRADWARGTAGTERREGMGEPQNDNGGEENMGVQLTPSVRWTE